MSFLGLFGGKDKMFTEPEKNTFKCLDQLKYQLDSISTFIDNEKKEDVDPKNNQFRMELISHCKLLKKMSFLISALYSKLLNVEIDEILKAKIIYFLNNEVVKIKIVDSVLSKEGFNYESLELYFGTLKQSVIKMEADLKQNISDARQRQLLLEQQNMKKAA